MTSDYNELSNRTLLAASIDGYDDFLNTYLYDELSRMISVEQTSVGTGILPVQDKQMNFTYNAASQFVFRNGVVLRVQLTLSRQLAYSA